MKRFIAALLVGALLLVCCACGQTFAGDFRELETIGVKHYSVICRKDDKLVPAVNAAVSVLAASGTLGSISTRWLGKDVITLRGDVGALDALEPEVRRIDRTLIVGVEGDFNPMVIEKDGEYTGMSVEIGAAIGEVLHCAVAFQPIEAAAVGAQLSSGNIDCAVGFDAALVDSGKYDVGAGYMDSDIVLAVRDESEVRRIRDLRGERIGIVEDPSVKAAITASDKVTKFASGATVYLTAERCFAALDNGWCAAVAMDRMRLVFRDAE